MKLISFDSIYKKLLVTFVVTGIIGNVFGDKLPEGTKQYEAILSAFCSCQHCCSYFIDKDGVPRFNLRPTVKKVIGQTACGAMARQGLTLAMPSCFKFGTHVYLEDGKLLGVCEDRGGAIRVRENKIKIDVYFESHQEALVFGVKHVKVNVSQP